MVSRSRFRTMGYIYAGLSLISSLLLLINSGHLVAGRGGVAFVAFVAFILLISSIISLLFIITLIGGFFMRKVSLITIHQRFVTTVYVLMMIAMFVCCIVAAISDDNKQGQDAIAAAVITITLNYIIQIVLLTLFYALISWILQGVIVAVNEDAIRLVSDSNSDYHGPE